MKKIAIVDYGLGNIFSIKQALKNCGVEPLVTESAREISQSDGILLPGVGAFNEAMKRLKSTQLDQVLIEQSQKGKPLLGVCLGLQLLFSKSHEFGEHLGLGLIEGEVIKFPETFAGAKLNTPFIGWNKLHINASQLDNPLIKGLTETDKFYFVHSYHAKPYDETCVIASCNYLEYNYPAIVQKNNICGIQGHPEKSAEQGLLFYKNWLNSI